MYKNVDDKRIIIIIYGILNKCCSADVVCGDFFFFFVLGILYIFRFDSGDKSLTSFASARIVLV